jgi:rubredoxin
LIAGSRSRLVLASKSKYILLDRRTLVVSDIGAATVEFKTWMCLICGWVYDEEQGMPEDGIAPGTKWDDIPLNWTCPECGARKEDFEMVVI